MVTTIRKGSLRCLIAGMLMSAIAVADDAEGVVSVRGNASEGVIRISDQSEQTTVRGQSSVTQATHSHAVYDGGQYCPPEGYPCPDGYSHHVFGNGCFANWLHANASAYRARNQMQSMALREVLHADCQEKAAWARGKFGYFIPSGCCGTGCPPVGCYSMVYPVDPSYFDPRDGQVYAAPGYGGPVSVPLAPVVNHTYNYGWGVPSSRLTPVLHPSPYAPVAVTPPPYPSAPVAH